MGVFVFERAFVVLIRVDAQPGRNREAQRTDGADPFGQRLSRDGDPDRIMRCRVVPGAVWRVNRERCDDAGGVLELAVEESLFGNATELCRFLGIRVGVGEQAREGGILGGLVGAADLEAREQRIRVQARAAVALEQFNELIEEILEERGLLIKKLEGERASPAGDDPR